MEFKITLYQIFTNSNNMHPDVYFCNLDCKIEFIKLLILFINTNKIIFIQEHPVMVEEVLVVESPSTTPENTTTLVSF